MDERYILAAASMTAVLFFGIFLLLNRGDLHTGGTKQSTVKIQQSMLLLRGRVGPVHGRDRLVVL